MDDTQRRVALLGKSRYFHTLSEEILKRIAAVTSFKTFEAGHLIIEEGTTADAMYILEEGAVDVCIKDNATGAEFLLRRLGEGACFGELAVITGRARTANVRAHQSVNVLVLMAADLTLLMEKLPGVGISMCRSLAEWVHNTNGQIGHRFIKLSSYTLDAETISLLSRKKIDYYKALPVHRDGNRIVVAMVDPTDLPTVDMLRREFEGCVIETAAVMESELQRVIDVQIPRILQCHDGWGD